MLSLTTANALPRDLQRLNVATKAIEAYTDDGSDDAAKSASARKAYEGAARHWQAPCLREMIDLKSKPSGVLHGRHRRLGRQSLHAPVSKRRNALYDALIKASSSCGPCIISGYLGL